LKVDKIGSVKVITPFYYKNVSGEGVQASHLPELLEGATSKCSTTKEVENTQNKKMVRLTSRNILVICVVPFEWH